MANKQEKILSLPVTKKKQIKTPLKQYFISKRFVTNLKTNLTIPGVGEIVKQTVTSIYYYFGNQFGVAQSN